MLDLKHISVLLKIQPQKKTYIYSTKKKKKVMQQSCQWWDCVNFWPQEGQKFWKYLLNIIFS